jgi:voltage-gated potassium channel Kch
VAGLRDTDTGAPARPRRARSRWRKRLRRRWEDHGWILLFVSALVALALGLAGFSRSDPSGSVSDSFYRAIQLFFVTAGAGVVDGPTPLALNIARFLALATTALVSIRAVFAIFGQRAARTWVRYLLRDHVIVCGLGRIGLRMANAFNDAGYRVVVIEEDAGHAAVEECQAEGIVVLIGDAEDRTLLWRAGVLNAQYLVSACGDDGANARVAVAAAAVVRGQRRQRLTCFVHIREEGLAGLLEEAAFVSHDEASCRFQFFNPVQSVPATLLEEFPAFDDPPDPARPPAVVVIGAGPLGSSLIANMARRWLSVASDGARLRIVVVDGQAEDAVAALRSRYPALDRAAELVVHDIEVGSPEFDRCAFLPRGSDNVDVRVYVSLDDDAWGLHAALAVHRKLRRREVPVVVLTTERGGLASLAGGAGAGLVKLKVFDVLDRTCRPEVLVYGTFELLARAIHRDYVRQQRAAGQTPQTNPALRDWDELDQAIKERNRHQAAHLGTKLDSVGCDIEPWTDWDSEPVMFSKEEVEALAGMEHERWCREREAEGWIYAPQRDDARRRSPYLLPWSELPETVKDWNRSTARSLPDFVARAGFVIVREEPAEAQPAGPASAGAIGGT